MQLLNTTRWTWTLYDSKHLLTYLLVTMMQDGVHLPRRQSFQMRRCQPSHRTGNHWSSQAPSSTGFLRSSYTSDDATFYAWWIGPVTPCRRPLLIHDSGLRPTVPGQSLPRPPCHPNHKISVHCHTVIRTDLNGSVIHDSAMLQIIMMGCEICDQNGKGMTTHSSTVT